MVSHLLPHHMTKIKTLTTVALGTLLLACAAPPANAQTEAQPKLPTANLTAGMYNIVAELAVTPQQWTQGLMFRRTMAAHEGMLFVGEQSEPRCFWMRNTYLPLTVAFVAEDGTIINLEDMQPLSDQSHCSTRPAAHVLEMNQGWFAKRGIKPGFRLHGAPFKP